MANPTSGRIFDIAVPAADRTINNETVNGAIVDMKDHDALMCIAEAGSLPANSLINMIWQGSHNGVNFVNYTRGTGFTDVNDNKLLIAVVERPKHRFIRMTFQNPQSTNAILKGAYYFAGLFADSVIPPDDDVALIRTFRTPGQIV